MASSALLTAQGWVCREQAVGAAIIQIMEIIAAPM